MLAVREANNEAARRLDTDRDRLLTRGDQIHSLPWRKGGPGSRKPRVASDERRTSGPSARPDHDTAV